MARMGDNRGVYRVLVIHLRERGRHHLVELHLSGRTMLNYIFTKYDD